MGSGGGELVLATLDPSLIDDWVVSELEGLGYSVRVVRVPSLEPGAVASLASRGWVVVPGSSPYDYSQLGGRVVKGSYSPRMLPFILRLATLDMLSPRMPAEKALEGLMESVARIVLEHASSRLEEAFSLGGVRVPLRPPPFIVVADLYYRGSISGTVEEASRMAGEGADIVVFSWSLGLDKSLFLKVVKAMLDSGVAPLGVDVPFIGAMVEALDSGAVLGMSLDLDSLGEVPRRVREEKAFVILPRTTEPPQAAIRDLERAVGRARGMGFEKIIVDPVLKPPFYGGLGASLERLLMAGRRIREPIMVGLNNVYEMIDADTTGSIALLVSIAGEMGASVLMGGEESCKSKGSISEIRRASLMASVALYVGMPPKDLGINLLGFKSKKC